MLHDEDVELILVEAVAFIGRIFLVRNRLELLLFNIDSDDSPQLSLHTIQKQLAVDLQPYQVHHDTIKGKSAPTSTKSVKDDAMNDEAGPSALETTSDGPASPAATPTETEDETGPLRFSAKRRLDELMFNLDRLILAELAVLYYMDNSFICLVARGLVQNVFMRRAQRTASAAPVLYANILCLILHLYRQRPEAGEALRGYLHGGLLLDFIGQQGPTSKWHLFLMDIFLAILQLVSHALLGKRKGMNKSRENVDLDVEERGESESDVIASGQAMVAEVYLSEMTLHS